MQEEHSQFMPQCLQVSEHAPQTGCLQGPSGWPAFPGHLFSAAGGQWGPFAQHSIAIEIRLVADFIELIDDCREPRDLVRS